MEAYGNVHTIVLFGGGGKSEFWASMIADITGMKINVPKTAETASVGAGMLAAKATGKILQPPECEKIYFPEHLKAYTEKYEKYRKIEKKLWA